MNLHFPLTIYPARFLFLVVENTSPALMLSLVLVTGRSILPLITHSNSSTIFLVMVFDKA